MPTISVFYGIIIQMFWNDHSPPHFQAKYCEHKAVVDIEKLEIIAGNLPRRALNLVLDWAEIHQTELLIAWDLCLQNKTPSKIEPLK